MNLVASIVGMPPNTNANSIILSGGFSVPEPIEANRKAITAMAQLACRNSIANSLYFIMGLFVSSQSGLNEKFVGLEKGFNWFRVFAVFEYVRFLFICFGK